MKKGKNMGKKGFTIIEVVLVLAIAGLIFLMVFVALPSLQRQQRNAQREEDIADLISAIKKYQTNNRGALPGNNEDNGIFEYGGDVKGWGGFLSDYLDKEKFVDPLSGDNYKINISTCSDQKTIGEPCGGSVKTAIEETFEKSDNTIYVVRQAKCAGDETRGAELSANMRRIAVLYKLEGNWLYCAES